MYGKGSMVEIESKKLLDERLQKKLYILLIIDAPEIEKVHEWVHSNSSKYRFEKVFLADIKATGSLQKPIGFVGLVKFNSLIEMKTGLLNIREEMQRYKDWRCDFMKADWVEIKGLERGPDEMTRQVTPEGRISFRQHRYFVTTRLQGEKVDLKLSDGNLEIYYQGTLVKRHLLRSQKP